MTIRHSGPSDQAFRDMGIDPEHARAFRAKRREEAGNLHQRKIEIDDAQRRLHGGPDCDRGPNGVSCYDMCQHCKREVARKVAEL